MRKGKQLRREQRLYLQSPVTLQEIETLKGIGDLKSPSVDGYGTKFLKARWNIIKEDVIAAIQELFSHGQLLRSFNKTIVTLIPKTSNVSCVKDYRHIDGCTTFYKIIATILTIRLGKVM